MDLTNRQRVWKLAKSLAGNPDLAPKYLRNCPWVTRSPLARGVPWWSFRAIEYLDQLLPADVAVFDWGSGGSTLFWARRGAHVLALEHDREWARRVAEALDAERVRNRVDLRLDPDWETKLRRSAEGGEVKWAGDDLSGFDLIAIDCGVDTADVRRECFRFAETQVRSGARILVDDVWRYPDLVRDNRATRVRIFESPGPCRWGVTSTAVFEY